MLFRGWKDLVHELGVFGFVAILIRSSFFVRKVLESRFFVHVGGLHIGEAVEHCCDVVYNRNLTDLLRVISWNKNELHTLKINGTKPNPDVLANAISKIRYVELTNLRLTANDLKRIYKKIVTCKTLITECFVFEHTGPNPTEAATTMLKTDPELFAEVAVRLKVFGAVVDRRLAKAILDKVYDCPGRKLEVLILDVRAIRSLNYSERRKSKLNYHEQFLENYSKEKFAIIKSKLRRLVLNVHGRSEEDYDPNVSLYDYEYGSSDSDDFDVYREQHDRRYGEQLGRKWYQQRRNSFGRRRSFGRGRVRGLLNYV